MWIKTESSLTIRGSAIAGYWINSSPAINRELPHDEQHSWLISTAGPLTEVRTRAACEFVLERLDEALILNPQRFDVRAVLAEFEKVSGISSKVK